MVREGSKAWLPPRWFVWAFWKAHRAFFRASGGRGLWPATADKWGALRLTVVGRRTGQARSVILGYVEDGANLVTLAMNGWGPEEPQWWLNLQAHPQAQVQLAGSKTLQVRARIATGDERARLWERYRHYDRQLDDYARRRPTETAVVVLEPLPVPSPQ
jgi:deazaflavin-dependent oxidoreductase (nitroreductase family)